MWQVTSLSYITYGMWTLRLGINVQRNVRLYTIIPSKFQVYSRTPLLRGPRFYAFFWPWNFPPYPFSMFKHINRLKSVLKLLIGSIYWTRPTDTATHSNTRARRLKTLHVHRETTSLFQTCNLVPWWSTQWDESRSNGSKFTGLQEKSANRNQLTLKLRYERGC